MPYPKKVPDAVVVRSYQRTGSVHRTAAETGLNHASVHERLCKLGVMASMNVFTEADEDRLRREYLIFRDAGRLEDLATAMGRTKHFLCRKARALGLTDQSSPKRFAGSWKYMDKAAARLLMDDFKGSVLGLRRFCKQKGYAEVSFWQTMKRFFPAEWSDVIDAKKPDDTTCGIGRGFEHATRNALRRLGYFAMLSPGSRSPIDVVAVKTGAVLFVQCKASGVFSPKEWNALYDLALSVGATPVLASHSRPPAIEFHKLGQRKDGSKKRQPFAPFLP